MDDDGPADLGFNAVECIRLTDRAPTQFLLQLFDFVDETSHLLFNRILEVLLEIRLGALGVILELDVRRP